MQSRRILPAFCSAVVSAVLLCSGLSFGQMTNLSDLNTTYGEGSPALTADALTMIFSSNRAGGAGSGDLYMTTRTAVGSAWSSPTLISELSTPANETECSISTDGLELAFSSGRTPTKGQNDVWITSRTAVTAPWNPPVPVDAVNTASNENGAFLGPDGLTLYWHVWQDRTKPTTSSPDDIWMATRPTREAAFSNPQPVAGINTTSGEDCPFVTADNLTMYFASNRTGGPGNMDIWIAKRATPASPWVVQGNAVEVNSPERDFHCVLNAQGTEFYVESERTGGLNPTKTADLWLLNHAPTKTAVDPTAWGLFK